MQFIVSDGRPSRLKRLHRVIQLITVILGISEKQADSLISCVEDSHGKLFITWFHPPTDIQRRAFAVAWADCKELPTNVFHETKE